MTLRIVTVNESGKVEIFSLRATSGLTKERIRFIAKSYANQCKAGGDTPAARRKALALLSESTQGMLTIDRRVLP
jgi:hypothetical protein